MGLIRFLIVFVILYFVFRVVLKPFLEGSQNKAPNNPSPKALTDKIVPCPACGTYNPSKKAYLVGEQFFCNETCASKK